MRDPAQVYRDQLAQLARSLATGTADSLRASLADGSTPDHVRLFTDDNAAKRRESLRARLEFLASAISDLDSRLTAYLESGPPAAHTNVSEDVAQFLNWLDQAGDLTAEQGDYLACQRARHAVELAARRDRVAHRHFQSLWRTTEQWLATLSTDTSLRIHLNPSRSAVRFGTGALLAEVAEPPVEVLFFAVGNEIATALLEAEGLALVEVLASATPCSLDRWAELSRVDREELADLCADLAGMGLVALESTATP
jgi:hypothetical protein